MAESWAIFGCFVVTLGAICWFTRWSKDPWWP
jgi:hypothetical protein